jgi:hypothetical protein
LKSNSGCEIWGSLGGEYEDCSLPGYEVLYFGGWVRIEVFEEISISIFRVGKFYTLKMEAVGSLKYYYLSTELYGVTL